MLMVIVGLFDLSCQAKATAYLLERLQDTNLRFRADAVSQETFLRACAYVEGRYLSRLLLCG